MKLKSNKAQEDPLIVIKRTGDVRHFIAWYSTEVVCVEDGQILLPGLAARQNGSTLVKFDSNSRIIAGESRGGTGHLKIPLEKSPRGKVEWQVPQLKAGIYMVEVTSGSKTYANSIPVQVSDGMHSLTSDLNTEAHTDFRLFRTQPLGKLTVGDSKIISFSWQKEKAGEKKNGLFIKALILHPMDIEE